MPESPVGGCWGGGVSQAGESRVGGGVDSNALSRLRIAWSVDAIGVYGMSFSVSKIHPGLWKCLRISTGGKRLK